MSDETTETRLRALERGEIELRAAQASHEALCAQRYSNIESMLDEGRARSRRMELLVIAAIITATGGSAALETAYRIASGGAGVAG